MKKFNGLTKGEIKRIEKFAQKRDGKDSRVTGCSYNVIPDEADGVEVRCEICSNNMEDRENDVVMWCFIPDRRRSFIVEYLSR